jgi:hypothetical protein
MKIELEVSIPDGYEATGEYRKVEGHSTPHLSASGNLCFTKSQNNRIILRKKTPVMRPMTTGEALWILSMPHCVIRHIDREEWEVPTIHAEYVQNYVYGFVNEGGAITSVSKFEKEIAE